MDAVMNVNVNMDGILFIGLLVTVCVEMGLLWEQKNVIQHLDVITEHVDVI